MNLLFRIKKKRALWWSGAGLLTALAAAALLGFGPLSSYVDETGKTVTPFLDNIILIITFIFFVPGMFYGYAVGKFRKLSDMVGAMSKQIGTMGYAIVLTFFSYNFLSLLTYTNLGTYITYIGAMGLQTVGASNSPILLIIGFILITGFINLFVGGLSSKWMLLGPIFCADAIPCKQLNDARCCCGGIQNCRFVNEYHNTAYDVCGSGAYVYAKV